MRQYGNELPVEFGSGFLDIHSTSTVISVPPHTVLKAACRSGACSSLDVTENHAGKRRSSRSKRSAAPSVRCSRAGRSVLVQFTSETTVLLKSIMPLHVEPDTPVFTNVDGEPIEPKAFSTHWYNCLRALGIRTRGLYCTKDTFCSLAVTRGVNPSWLEQQTGVAWATLKKHYAKYVPDEGRDEFEVMTGGRSLTGLSGSTTDRKR